jgi:hypothetical protein
MPPARLQAWPVDRARLLRSQQPIAARTTRWPVGSMAARRFDAGLSRERTPRSERAAAPASDPFGIETAASAMYRGRQWALGWVLG